MTHMKPEGDSTPTPPCGTYTHVLSGFPPAFTQTSYLWPVFCFLLLCVFLFDVFVCLLFCCVCCFVCALSCFCCFFFVFCCCCLFCCFWCFVFVLLFVVCCCVFFYLFVKIMNKTCCMVHCLSSRCFFSVWRNVTSRFEHRMCSRLIIIDHASAFVVFR